MQTVNPGTATTSIPKNSLVRVEEVRRLPARSQRVFNHRPGCDCTGGSPPAAAAAASSVEQAHSAGPVRSPTKSTSSRKRAMDPDRQQAAAEEVDTTESNAAANGSAPPNPSTPKKTASQANFILVPVPAHVGPVRSFSSSSAAPSAEMSAHVLNRQHLLILGLNSASV